METSPRWHVPRTSIICEIERLGAAVFRQYGTTVIYDENGVARERNLSRLYALTGSAIAEERVRPCERPRECDIVWVAALRSA